MKRIIFTLLLVVAAGCRTSVISSRAGDEHLPDLSIDQVMDIVAQLRPGMPEAEADALLAAKGLKASGPVLGDDFFRGDFVPVSKKYQLCIGCKRARPRSSGWVVETIDIQTRNSRDPLNIMEITPHIERNPVYKFKLDKPDANKPPDGTR